MSRIRSKLTFANVTSMIALLVALSGTALALQNNTVRSRHIVNGQVRTPDLGKLFVRSADGTQIPGGIAANGAYETGFSQAYCQNGEIAVSGGGKFLADSAEDKALWLQESVPFDFDFEGDPNVVNPRAWRVVGGNDSGQDEILRAYVVCLQAKP